MVLDISQCCWRRGGLECRGGGAHLKFAVPATLTLGCGDWLVKDVEVPPPAFLRVEILLALVDLAVPLPQPITGFHITGRIFRYQNHITRGLPDREFCESVSLPHERVKSWSGFEGISVFCPKEMWSVQRLLLLLSPGPPC